ncbi:hypothetical protein DEO72_LG10g1281 [Vigna unguiculata]|uniref:Uncharacterized protein n=1 Tax=Vigna unguiculata TaxID=3917 RepID=A0A4D6ND46_VIGUN|nr:hypothetical protein DEO72_LG10g1281 [Vigna unguiculata]
MPDDLDSLRKSNNTDGSGGPNDPHGPHHQNEPNDPNRFNVPDDPNEPDDEPDDQDSPNEPNEPDEANGPETNGSSGPSGLFDHSRGCWARPGRWAHLALRTCLGDLAHRNNVVENETHVVVVDGLVVDHEEYVVDGASDVQHNVAAEGEIVSDANGNVNEVEECEFLDRAKVSRDENNVVVNFAKGDTDMN